VAMDEPALVNMFEVLCKNLFFPEQNVFPSESPCTIRHSLIFLRFFVCVSKALFLGGNVFQVFCLCVLRTCVLYV
jgi:hypothetical protein